uniref:Uncharacterized protein n=1 Tax=Amphora coffeiformis TaxID=265554 RepID=A0A7S3P9K5_9STRA|mmetsp:Transcript_23815/g.45338  ORF Transcript_23815/g.45338 Transcript_23815/m.45338 type:complete len:255 (-) Transcript_23815:191-955(-)
MKLSLLWLFLLVAVRAFVLNHCHPTKTTRLALSSSRTNHEQYHDELMYLRKQYHNLLQQHERLRQDNNDVSLTTTLAADLLDIQLQLTTAARLEQEDKAATAHEEMQWAIQELQWATTLKEQARQETNWAVDESVWLASSTTKATKMADSSQNIKNEVLEQSLLAHAVHDIKETETRWQNAQTKRLVALQKEVQAKDLLWSLVQKEETLQALQGSDTKALQAWVEHEIALHNSKELPTEDHGNLNKHSTSNLMP